MIRRDLLVVAGEASGDQHAARLLRALGAARPDLRAFGLGSGELRAAGAELLADSREISVVGITEALAVLPRARVILKRLIAEAERRRPVAAVLVDFPEFNLRLARHLKWLGIPVVYYVSPQIWAWRRWRVRTIAQCVDRMLVLFPFESKFYEGQHVSVVHVGHPLVDEVPEQPQAWDFEPAETMPEVARIALLPGSRPSEIAALLPLQLEALRRLARRRNVKATLVRAPSIAPELLERHLAAFVDLPLEIVTENRLERIADSHLAFCASGTATLEVGLLRTPLIMLYRLQPWTWRLARLLVRVPHASLVNLVLEEAVVPELLQAKANPENLAGVADRLLSDRAAVDRMRDALAGLRGRLGRPGASERAAAEVLAVVEAEERAA
jgi:lipid-A-disaccharide synthase